MTASRPARGARPTVSVLAVTKPLATKPLATKPLATELRPATLRRRVHLSTAVILVLALPRLALSLAVLVALAVLILGRSDMAVWVTVGVFVATGPLVLVPAVESVLARGLFRLRRPTDREHHRLDRAWTGVSAAAGIDGGRYTLWIEESRALNAFAAAGHTVAVTDWAVANLPPRHLEAVLAHELGHHLGGHTWASMLSHWYSLPGRWFLWLARRVVFVVVAALGVIAAAFDRTGLVGRVFLPLLLRVLPVLLLAGVAYVGYSIHPATLLLFTIPWLLAFSGRLGERHADALAAEMGYRAEMLAVLHAFRRSGHDAARARARWQDRLLTSHPSCAERIRALEQQRK